MSRLLFAQCKEQYEGAVAASEGAAADKKAPDMLVYSKTWLEKVTGGADGNNWAIPVSMLTEEESYSRSLSLMHESPETMHLYRLFSLSFLKSEPWVRYYKNAHTAAFAPQLGADGCFAVSASLWHIRTQLKLEGTETADKKFIRNNRSMDAFFPAKQPLADLLLLLGQAPGDALLSAKPVGEPVTMKPNSGGGTIPSLLYDSIASARQVLESLYTVTSGTNPLSRFSIYNITGHLAKSWAVKDEESGVITFSDFSELPDVCEENVTFLLAHPFVSETFNELERMQIELAEQIHTDFVRGPYNQVFIKEFLCSLAVQYEPRDVKVIQRYTGDLSEAFCGVKWDGADLSITNSENQFFAKSSTAMKRFPKGSYKTLFEADAKNAKESSQKKAKTDKVEERLTFKPMNEFITKAGNLKKVKGSSGKKGQANNNKKRL